MCLQWLPFGSEQASLSVPELIRKQHGIGRRGLPLSAPGCKWEFSGFCSWKRQVWPPASRGADKCFQVKAFDSHQHHLHPGSPSCCRDFSKLTIEHPLGHFMLGLIVCFAVLIPGIKGGSRDRGLLHMWSCYSEMPEDFNSVGQTQQNKLDFYLRKG